MNRRPLNQDELQLIDLIYNAAMDFSQWPIFLENVRQLCDAYHVNLIFYDSQNRLRNSFTSVGPSSSLGERYLSSFIDLDNQWARKAFSNAPLGTAIGRNHPCAADTIRLKQLMDPVLAEYYATEIPYGDKLICIPFQSNHSQSGLSINRHKDQPVFPEAAADLLNTLGPHLCRAIRIHNQLSAVAEEHQQLLDIIEKVNVGVALLDSNGSVMFSNNEASRIFENHSGIRIGLGGRVCAAHRSEQNALATLINTATAAIDDIGLLNLQPTTTVVHGNNETHPLKISVLPLKGADLNFSHLSPAISTVMFLTDVTRKCHVAPEYLRLAYNLSPAESAIAKMLLDGHAIETMAALRSTSEETARKQIKSILRKTNTHSQRELMRILVNLSQDFSIPIA